MGIWKDGQSMLWLAKRDFIKQKKKHKKQKAHKDIKTKQVNDKNQGREEHKNKKGTTREQPMQNSSKHGVATATNTQ